MEDDSLYYYQGYHDIVEFLLLFSNFDMDWTYTMMKALTKQYLRDYMHSNMTEVEKLLQLLYPILDVRAHDLIPILRNPVIVMFSSNQQEKSPIVILPWIITLFDLINMLYIDLHIHYHLQNKQLVYLMLFSFILLCLSTQLLQLYFISRKNYLLQKNVVKYTRYWGYFWSIENDEQKLNKYELPLEGILSMT